MNAAIHWSGPVLIAGALTFGLGVISISTRPVIAATLGPDGAALLLASAALLILSMPAVYAVQADAAGLLGLVGHGLLTIGLLLLVVLAATPLLYPSMNGPMGEHPLVFVLGIALTLGLLLTAIATFQANVFPRPAALLLLGAMAGFFFVFFVAEFLPPAAGQIGGAVFGAMLALGFSWIGVALWTRPAG
jgi:hypothetical protein